MQARIRNRVGNFGNGRVTFAEIVSFVLDSV
jgi:hypothetical protein